jgi:hypothetical protein
MKLSEAILLGSTIRPQTYGVAFDVVGSCAFGAAMEAVGCKYKPEGLSTAEEYTTYNILTAWPWLEASREPCPECHRKTIIGTREVISMHLNDKHKWSRERIAEWVSTIEPADNPADAAVTREREAEAVETSQS